MKTSAKISPAKISPAKKSSAKKSTSAKASAAVRRPQKSSPRKKAPAALAGNLAPLFDATADKNLTITESFYQEKKYPQPENFNELKNFADAADDTADFGLAEELAILNNAKNNTKKSDAPSGANSASAISFGRFFWGVIILLIGLLYLGQNWGIFPFTIHLTFNQVWPAILILLGLYFLNRRVLLSIFLGIMGAVVFVLLLVFVIIYVNKTQTPVNNSPTVSQIEETTLTPDATSTEEATTTDLNLATSSDAVDISPLDLKTATGSPLAAASINLTNLKANQLVRTPLKIKGQATGNWFFEGSFPIRLIDENKTEIGATQAQAVGNWMTSGLVDFTANLIFAKTTSTRGILIFRRDNPSGLERNAERYMIPVNLK
jgi:hypothetical protein